MEIKFGWTYEAYYLPVEGGYMRYIYHYGETRNTWTVSGPFPQSGW